MKYFNFGRDVILLSQVECLYQCLFPERCSPLNSSNPMDYLNKLGVVFTIGVTQRTPYLVKKQCHTVQYYTRSLFERKHHQTLNA